MYSGDQKTLELEDNFKTQLMAAILQCEQTYFD